MTEKKPLIKTTVENALKVIREYPAHKVAVVVYIRDEDFQKVSPNEFEALQSAERHYEIIKEVQKRVARELGKEVILVPFDFEDYTQWLSLQQLENTQAHRGAWAAFKAGLAN